MFCHWEHDRISAIKSIEKKPCPFFTGQMRYQIIFEISKYTIPCPLMIGGARVGSFGTGYIFSAGVMLGAGVGCPG
jgi:hypothetical protein